MRKLFMALVILLYVCLAFELVSGQEQQVAGAANDEGNTAFALDLYAKLTQKEGNFFFSPYSISTALAMAYSGARGETEKQMAKVLHFPASQEELHARLSHLQAQLNAVQGKGAIELSVANGLWAQKDYVFLPEFLEVTKKYYGAAPKQVDFKGNAEAARQEINRWVERETKNRIKELLRSGLVDPQIRLVLTNAIYFKGRWKHEFDPGRTEPMPFRLSPDKSVEVPMMRQEDGFGYAQNPILQILELPYADGEVSIIVILPQHSDGLAQVEAQLCVENLQMWMAHVRRDHVKVSLPKFGVASEFELSELRKVLAEMGMPDAFNERADFSGMDGKRSLFISFVAHKSFMQVDEQGTEAAAATAVGFKNGPKRFVADHPFLFFICHNPSRAILFMGRLVNPKE